MANYKNAFKCKKCPQSNGENGCPMWWEFMAFEIGSSKEELKKMCGYQALPIFLIETVRASNRPAAELGALRTAFVNKMEQVEQSMKPRELKELTNGT